MWQLRSVLQDLEEVKDVAHDCLIKVWMRRGSFPHESKRTSWVYPIAANEPASR